MNEDDDEFSEAGSAAGSDQLAAGSSVSAFSLREIEYRRVLAKMQDDEQLATVGQEFTDLFDAYAEAYRNEQELARKRDELENRLEFSAADVEDLKERIQEDESKLAELTANLEAARKLADLAHSREQHAHEVIENMRVQVMKLNAELELKAKMGGEDGEESALSKTKEGFEREKQRILYEMLSLKQKLENALSYSQELERKNSLADIKTAEMNAVIDQQANEIVKQQHAIDKLAAEAKSGQDRVKELEDKIADIEKARSTLYQQYEQAEIKMRELKEQQDRAKKEVDALEVALDSAQSENDHLKENVRSFRDKNVKIGKQLRLQNDENVRLIGDMQKITKLKNSAELKISKAMAARAKMEEERDRLRTHIDVLDRQLMLDKKQAELDKRSIENVTREKEILHKNIMRLQGVIEGHMKLIKIQEQSKRKLETDMQELKVDSSLKRKELDKMENERNRALEETLDLTQQAEDAMDEIKMKQTEIYDLKKMIAELETKLRQQQNLFEVVRADRNAFQKSLHEATAEIGELKNKLKISNHQSEQLKEDIAAKETRLITCENVLRKVNKEKENLKVDVQNGLDQIHKLRSEIRELAQTEKRLTLLVQENDATIRKQQKDFDQIMGDRDVIGAQLVRRNDEISLLYEKINILQITLQRGNAHYDQRIEDVRLLKLEIKRLLLEKSLLGKTIANMVDLKTEVFQLERELAQERLKSRALEEELQHPINIHRWRKLEGSDPAKLELLRKVQILQRRILAQSTRMIEKEKQLKETQTLYLNLRQVLARQPGPDVKTELVNAHKALKVRGDRMKCLVSELNMAENQAREYKLDLDKVNEELRELKLKYLTQKKKMTRQQQYAVVPVVPGLPMLPASAPSTSEFKLPRAKFAGGGFKMTSVCL